MPIIPRLKFWLKAVELFLLQTPIFLVSIFIYIFVALPTALLHNQDNAIIAIIYCLVFIVITSLLFAYYWQWGKEKPSHNIKFLPSKEGFLEGVAMTLIAFSTNVLSSIFLSEWQLRSIGYDLRQWLVKFQQPDGSTILFVIWWLYLASHGFQLKAKLLDKKS